MELVFAAIVWNAGLIHYVPMSPRACEAAWRRSIIEWHPRVVKAPVIECLRAKWTCERGFQFVEPAAPATN